MSDLKPCPFCGKEPSQTTAELGDRPCFYYECGNPKCHAAEMGWHDTEQEARDAWNNRPIEDALRKEIAQLQADNRSLVEQMNAIANVCPSTDEYKIELRNLNHIPESPKKDDVEKPKPESENIIHGHIPADMRLIYIDLDKYKVGDWVEIESPHTKGKTFVSVIKEMPNQEHRTVHVNSYCGGYYEIMESQIVRKLKPSEVIVNIGCLSGTVEKAYGEKKGTFILNGLSGQRNVLWLSMLGSKTRKLVEGLLKAQKDE